MSEAKKTATAVAGQEAKTTKQTVISKGTVMYIGPSIKNVVTTGTLYNNGLPKILMQEIEKQPVIKNLIVPVNDLAKAQKELATSGSALRIIYDKVVTK